MDLIRLGAYLLTNLTAKGCAIQAGKIDRCTKSCKSRCGTAAGRRAKCTPTSPRTRHRHSKNTANSDYRISAGSTASHVGFRVRRSGYSSRLRLLFCQGLAVSFYSFASTQAVFPARPVCVVNLWSPRVWPRTVVQVDLSRRVGHGTCRLDGRGARHRHVSF